jgi:hypothetical protein
MDPRQLYLMAQFLTQELAKEPATYDGKVLKLHGKVLEHGDRARDAIAVVTISDRITDIGPNAFAGCSSIRSITIPEGVISIGGWAFNGCTSLESITVPQTLTTIGMCAFAGTSSLRSITLPPGIIIEEWAFLGSGARSFVENRSR